MSLINRQVRQVSGRKLYRERALMLYAHCLCRRMYWRERRWQPDCSDNLTTRAMVIRRMNRYEQWWIACYRAYIRGAVSTGKRTAVSDE